MRFPSKALLLLVAIVSAQAAGRQFLRRHVPEAVAASTPLRALPRTDRITLAVGLPLRNQEELAAFLSQLSDSSSPNYRHYLTSTEFSERFGPSETDYQALASFFRGNGLLVTGTHPNRMILDVSGTVPEIESTFHVNMMYWHHPRRGAFFAPDREPSLDAGIAILDVTGLDNFVLPRPMDLKSQPLDAISLTTGSGPGGNFMGADFRKAYAPGVTLNGTGQSVGLFELDGFYAADVQANFQQAGLPTVPVQTVLLNNFNGAPGQNNVEVTLDIMMAAYMAPGLKNIIVYEGTNWNDVLNRMATDNQASQLSVSWAFYPTNATTEQIFSQMIAQGQSLFQASGDSGGYSGWIMPPSDDPNVTVVGGTSLTTAGAGGAWQSETTWNGSGGGYSTVWPIPSYQQASKMSAAGGSSTMRNIPDVALTADVQLFLICNNGQWIRVGGTSAAAPLWAGFLALANQQALANGKPAVGFLNPVIYGIGAGSRFQNDLHDITTGNNNRFNSLAGFDLATGWGSPTGQPLIDDLAGASNLPAFGLSFSAPSLTVAAGASGSSTLTIGPQNGFTGAVNLTVSGLPSGVTASFSPSSATTTSTLTLTASASVISSTSTVTITGTSGSLTSTARLALTVTGTSSFALSASPASISITQGVSAVSTITITAVGGFTGAVTLAASGLPTGVTAAFGAITANKTSVLTVTTTTSAALGTSTVTITGTSGSLRSTAAISLTITAPPAFTISAAPASVTALRGAATASTIAITPVNGFTGAVTLAASGLPTGVTASFGTVSPTKTVPLTLTASASAVLGNFNVVITGTSGALHPTATISLTVAAPPSFTIAAAPASLSIVQGTITASTVTITPAGDFKGTVTFTTSALPTGLTASFGAVTANKSIVTFTSTASAPASTSTITITGASGTLTSKATISFTITALPTFTLAANPTALSLPQGGSATGMLPITALNGFKGVVTFTASGLPTGVTAIFGAVIDNKGVVTFRAASTAATGVATVTITGTSGTLTSKATIALTVTPPPNFTIAATPASVAVKPGASATSTVAITALYGFNGAVTFAASGLPTGATATFGAVSAGKSVLTIATTPTAATGPATIVITGTSGNLTSKTSLALTVTALPTFTFAASPAALSILPGTKASTTLTLTPLNGFKDPVLLSTPVMPNGIVIGFSNGSIPTQCVVTFTIGTAVAPGPYTVTITGKSSSIIQTAAITLTVGSANGTAKVVNIASLYNVAGIVTDKSTFTSGGLDGGGRAYSANLLGGVQTVNGTAFNIGPANTLDAVSGTTIPLPSGQFSTITLLATGLNGAQTAQTFTVTYTDGSTTQFTQSLSDWCVPQNFPGESVAVPMSYRNNSTGTQDVRFMALYGYTFNLAAGKTVSSIALPKNRNVVVLAAALGTAVSAAR